MKRYAPLVAVIAAVLLMSLAHAQAKTAAGAKPKAAPARAAAAKEPPAALDSLGVLEHAVARDSSRFDDLYKLGVMYMDRDRTDEAAKVLSRAHQLRPNDLKTLVNLGAAYDAAGKADIAQIWYDQALKVAPGDSVALCRKASSIYGQGKYSEAMDMMRDIIKKSPNAFCAYFTMGVAFADAGLYRDAIRMWRKVVDIAPSSPEAVSARESIDVLEKFLLQPATPAAPVTPSTH